MSKSSIGLNDALDRYVAEISLHDREPDPMRRLRLASDELAEGNMRSSSEQVQFLMLLLRAIGAMKVIEVGVFTGYATLGFALAVPARGRVIALDRTDRWLAAGRREWQAAGVADRIDFRQGDARDALDAMAAQGETGTVDFAFIDADKPGYEDYYERCLTLVRPGGLIAVDNVLWHGRVVDPDAQDDDTVAIRRFNRKVHLDGRVDLALVPIGDGVTLLRKR
ncbi:putative O-methyltransferase YrrM [Rhodothalassium salexigens DSM 2132]|uniref:Putative O-methyltransferase YrrM n=1 Tax=Rhodothalassium salexigens DSM 2132 TaxID=1188247 RepID=A0A4R2PH81_RHOSA|nr:class I SAM-dependent methyltransferase [Rhodothalassium salexigens]MBB4211708.1 putative O-methyltransferase YrrM [Rhodothalassium salexigens DSM 2132]MBK1639170.1 SAM-dependent methyltransferase [Rhodothalassium salexigens DSM 2132]TCP33994.1 putative O-methyltransferase YrrM [Rhodothalassium salexigens DSM 2132]